MSCSSRGPLERVWDFFFGGPTLADVVEARRGCSERNNSDRQADVARASSLYSDVQSHLASANQQLALRAGSAGAMGSRSEAIASLQAARDRLNSRQEHETLTTGQAATLATLVGTAHGYALGDSEIAGLHLSITSALSSAAQGSSSASTGCGS